MNISSIKPDAHTGAPLAQLVTKEQATQRRQLLQAVKEVNNSGVLDRNQLVFMVDRQTHRPIIRVEDRETHEVVLQLPPEYILRLAETLSSGTQ